MKRNIISRLMLLVALLFTTLFGRAQSAEYLPQAGANAHSLTSTLATHAGLHTGDLQVELPLLTLPGKGIDIPISLAFSSGGIDHTTEASCIGLGWSLKAGGVITGTINGEDDWAITSLKNKTWWYNQEYLENLYFNNTNRPDIVADSITKIMNDKNKPDSYRYVLPDGRSGDINFMADANHNLQVNIFPDNDCRIARTANGFLLTDNNGIEYYFETKETIMKEHVSQVSQTAWYLSRIITPNDGEVTFSYADENYTNFRMEDTKVNHPYRYGNHFHTKRLTRIDSEFGYVLFNSESRDDMDNAREITSIELYAPNGNLVKGFGLTHGYFLTNGEESPHYDKANSRLSLSGVYEYDSQKNPLPGYTFTYDYLFSRGKDSYRLCNMSGVDCLRGTWAAPAASIAVIDRNSMGNPACWAVSVPGYNAAYGFDLVETNSDITIDDYFCLTQVDLPTGGYESYSYEAHDYYYSGESNSPVFESKDVAGKRLSKKVVSASDGSPTLTYNYIYKLHNADYSLTGHSSGILVNPSIHTSARYTPIKEENHDRLVATAFKTEKPQNSLDIPAICYTEVEEVISYGTTPVNRTIFYYGKYELSTANNYFYSNYEYSTSDYTRGMLVFIPNKIYGRQENYTGNLAGQSSTDYTYMAYPVGKYYEESGLAGNLLKQVFLNSSNRVVRKVENEYTIHSTSNLYSYKIEQYNVVDVQTKPVDFMNLAIARSKHGHKRSKLHKSVITDYFPLEGSVINDSVITSQEYSKLGSRPYRKSITMNGITTTEESYYPDQISMGTSSNLSGAALAISQMRSKNVIGLPIQKITKHNGVIQSSTYHTYKQLSNGMVVPDSVYRLKPSEAGTLNHPYINAQGKVEMNAAYEYLEHYPSYNTSGHPWQISRRGEPSVVLDWGYNHRYVTARVENITYSELEDDLNFHTYMARLKEYTIITDSNRAAFNQINKYLRQFLPSGALLTTYTYDPLLGITSECNPLGDTIFYEYDSYGRLARTRNTNGEVIKEYEYHYAN